MNIIVQIIALILILATGISFFNHKAWWVRIFDFPRIQIALLTLMVLVAYIFVRFSALYWVDLILIVLLFATFSIQAYHILRFLRIFRVEIEDTDSREPELKLSIYILNVLMENRKSEKLLQQIQKYNPDLICIVETDHWWHNQLEHLKKTYPFQIAVPKDDTYGMHLLSKFELLNSQVKHLIEEEVPSIHTEFTFGGYTIKASLLHPKPPAPNEAWSSQNRDQEILLMAHEIQKSQEPYILMGDLNDVAWSDTMRHFKKVSGLLDPRRGRGFFNTYNAKNPFLRWPLDHAFVSHHFRVVKMKRLKMIESDHLPILLVLSIPK